MKMFVLRNYFTLFIIAFLTLYIEAELKLLTEQYGPTSYHVDTLSCHLLGHDGMMVRVLIQ